MRSSSKFSGHGGGSIKNFEGLILQHMLSVTASSQPTSLSALLAPSSSSSSISLRSLARRALSGCDKSTLSLTPRTSYCIVPHGGREKWFFVTFLLCSGFRYIFLFNWRHIFSSLEKEIGKSLAPGHAIYLKAGLGPAWTLTYLDISVDKVSLFFLAIGRSTTDASKLLFPGLLTVYFKWFRGAVWSRFACQANQQFSKRQISRK